MSEQKMVMVRAKRGHDGHRRGDEFPLSADVAKMQAGFGWVKVIGDVQDDGDIRGGPGTGSEVAPVDGPESGGSAG